MVTSISKKGKGTWPQPFPHLQSVVNIIDLGAEVQFGCIITYIASVPEILGILIAKPNLFQDSDITK